MSVRIVTDSSCDLPADVVAEHGIGRYTCAIRHREPLRRVGHVVLHGADAPLLVAGVQVVLPVAGAGAVVDLHDRVAAGADIARGSDRNDFAMLVDDLYVHARCRSSDRGESVRVHRGTHCQRMRNRLRALTNRVALLEIDRSVRFADTFDIGRLLRERAKGRQAGGVWHGHISRGSFSFGPHTTGPPTIAKRNRTRLTLCNNKVL